MVVSRLRPLGVKLDFGDQSYKLGETFDISVELNPRGDVEVREGRVDLVCNTAGFGYGRASEGLAKDFLFAAKGLPCRPNRGGQHIC